MEAYRLTIFLIFVASCLIFSCQATSCSSDKECFHFEYCCKGNCTWTKLKCEHICQLDHECSSDSRCVLGICENCTSEFPCTRKSCLNDSHCPGEHSCQKKLCEVMKKSNLTSEMAPFLIFITALSVSLLIVCYNDYFLERFGQRRWRERLERLSCNCSLTLWFWMWRLRRSRQRTNENSSCPGVQVQFDSWSTNPSNTLNEKPTSRQTFWTLRSFKRILFFWRTNREDIEQCSLPLEGNNSEDSTRNVRSSNPVILLNGFMNTNDLVTNSSSLNHQSSSSRDQDSERSESGQNTTQTALNCSCTILDSNGLGTCTETSITRSDHQDFEVNNSINTHSHEVTTV